MQPAGPRAEAEQITVEAVMELFEPRNKKPKYTKQIRKKLQSSNLNKKENNLV